MNSKFSRILSLILALALTLTSFVAVGVVAEAADEVVGKTTLAYEDFSDAANMNFTWVKDAADTGTNPHDGIFGYQASIHTDTYYRFQYVPAENISANTKDMYFSVDIADTDLTALRYYVVDFEFSYETPSIDGFYFDFGGAQKLYFNSVDGNLFFGDEYDVVDKNSSDIGITNNYEWAHYTFVVDVLTDTLYAYVNGEIQYDLYGIFGTTTTVSDFKIGFLPGQAHLIANLCFDKIAINTYDLNTNVEFDTILGDGATLATCGDPALACITKATQTGSPIALAYKPGSSKPVYYYSAYDFGSQTTLGDATKILRPISTPVFFTNDYGDAVAVGADTSTGVSIANTAYKTSFTKVLAKGAIASVTRYRTNGNATNIQTLFYTDSVLPTMASDLRWHGYDTTVMHLIEFYKDWDIVDTADVANDASFMTGAGPAMYTFNLHGHKVNSFEGTTATKGALFAKDGSALFFRVAGNYVFNNAVFVADYYNIDTAGPAGTTLFFTDCVFNPDGEAVNHPFYMSNTNVTVRMNSCVYNNWFRMVAASGAGTRYLSLNNTKVSVPNISYQYQIFNIQNNNADGVVYDISVKYSDLNQAMGGWFVYCAKANYTTTVNADFYATKINIPTNKAYERGSLVSVLNKASANVNLDDVAISQMGAFALTANPDASAKVVINVKNGCYTKNQAETAWGDATPVTINYEKDSYYRALDNAPAGYTYGTAKVDLKPLANMTLKSDFNFNIYVPTDADVKSVTVGGDTYTFTEADIADIGGKDYYKYVNAGIMVTDAADTFDVTFNIAHEDGITYAATKTFDVISYAAKVLATPAYAEQQTLMVDMLTYVKEAYAYAEIDDAEAVSRINAALDGKTASTYAPTATETDQTAIKAYVDSAFMSLDNVPCVIFTVAQDCNVTLSYYDVKTETTVTETYAKKAGEYIELDMRAYNLVNEITISVEGVGEGTYDLYTYVESQKDNSAYALLKALYNYAVAAKAQA